MTPGLLCDSYLKGGERIHAKGVTPGGQLETVVPAVAVEVETFLEDRVETAQVNLDTVVVMPDRGWLSLTWRSLVATSCAPSAVRGFRIRESSMVAGTRGLQ